MKTFHEAILRAADGGTGGGDAAAAAAAAAAEAAKTAWVPATIDADTKGYLENRGWDKKPVTDVVFEAIKAHRESEKFLGVPAAQLLRIPKDLSDEAGWKTVRERLGAPKDAKEYDASFTGVEFADKTAPDDSFKATLKGVATRHGWSPAVLTDVTKSLVKLIDEDDKADATVNQQDLALETAKLRTNWGPNYDGFRIVALKAAEKLGPDFVEAAKAFETQVGYARTMEIFRLLGNSFGEDSFLRNGQTVNGELYTKDGAGARLKELQADPVWRDAFLKGDAAKKREHDALVAIMKPAA